MEVPSKVISSGVLANRNVNALKSSLVTKPLFSNKIEGPEKSKINNYFSMSSKDKSNSISPAATTAPCASPVPDIKVTTAPPTDSQVSGGKNTSVDLDSSVGFPIDNWDDFDDFEIPAKTKNDSFGSEKSGNSTTQVSKAVDEKTEVTARGRLVTSSKNTTSKSDSEDLCQLEVNEDKNAASPGPSFDLDPEDLLGDSPVLPTRRRRSVAKVKSVVNESEDEGFNLVSEPSKEPRGKILDLLQQMYSILLGFM